MKKRITAFFMALLMVLTILPVNFTIVEANDANRAIYLKVIGEQDWESTDDVSIIVKNSLGEVIDNDAINKEIDEAATVADDLSNSFNGINVAITGLKDGTYTIDIASDGYLSWKKDLSTVEESNSPVYEEITMAQDVYTDYDFSNDFSNWKVKDTKTLTVVNSQNKLVQYASSDSDIASVDETTGVVTINKAGTVSFSATLTDGDNYKTITQSDVVIEKLDQHLSFVNTISSVYVGDEVTVTAKPDADDASGTITYSVVSGADYISLDGDFTNNGKWTAVSYNDVTEGVDVEIKAYISEDEKYKCTEATYTTKIVPVQYGDFNEYCTIEGESRQDSDGKVWYSSVSAIKAKDGYKIKSNGELLSEISVDSSQIVQGENIQILTLTDANGNRGGDVSVFYNYDNVNPNVEISLVDKEENSDTPFQIMGSGDNRVEYYNHDRMALVKVSDTNFDSQNVSINVSVDGEKAINVLSETGNSVDSVQIVKFDGEIWKAEAGEYVARIALLGDHKYTIDATATDKAGNPSDECTITNSASKTFLIDKSIPKGSIQYSTTATSGGLFGAKYDKLINQQEYTESVFKKEQLYITGNVSDSFSGICSLDYYVSESDKILTDNDLKNVVVWNQLSVNNGTYSQLIDKADSKYIVYLRITDNCGNISYVSTNGTVVDTVAPKIENVDIVSVTENNSYNILVNQEVELWNTDPVYLQVNTTDNLSGIGKIVYSVSKKNEKGDYTDLNTETISLNEAELGQTNLSKIIKIAKSDYYSEGTKALRVTIKVYDRADNVSETCKDINIDSTKPETSIELDSEKSSAFTGDWNNGTLVYRVCATDNASGIVVKDGVPIITYTISNEDGKIDEGKVAIDIANCKVDAATKAYTEVNGTITINGSKYNSKNLKIVVNTNDAAGNKADTKSISAKYDCSAPNASISLNSSMKNSLGIEKAKHFFNKEVKLDISVKDDIAGIKSIKYYVTAGGNAPTEDVWNVSGKNVFPTQTDTIGTNAKVNKQIVIGKDFINSVNGLGAVNVYLQVIDIAGNEIVVNLNDSKKDDTFRIDTVKPTINIDFNDEKSAYSTIDGVEYYNSQRMATISVTENSVFFDPELVKIWVSEDGGEEVDINAVDQLPDGIVIDGNKWSIGTGDNAISTFNVRFINDHKYTIRVEAKDLAGNVDTGYSINKSNTFVIDRVNPTGNIKYNNLSGGEDIEWSSFVNWGNILNGGKYEISHFSQGNMYVSGFVKDDFSGVKEVSYYISSNDGVFSDESGVTEWIPTDITNIDGSYAINMPAINMNYIVYLKIVDYSGNVSYTSTNGAVLDTQAPVINVTLPANTNGIYSSNVNVDVAVSDNSETGIVSGIKSISYKVTSLGMQTQSGDLYTYSETAESLNDLKKSISGSFIVDASANNSNDVKIEVTAVDNAGNTYTSLNVIKIDTTAPTIEVSYDNNNGDTSFGDTAYFKDARTATIKVTERNFDSSKVSPVITSSNGSVPSISEWTTVGGTGNGDDTAHIATIYFGNDTDYTFNISVEDIAGNRSGDANFGSSLAPTMFTVDKIIPVISVAYDNNNAAEAGFYKEQRTATVTIQEHNFESSRVVLTMNATDDGNTVASPSIGNWADNGDSHTATISFSFDAEYTWSLGYTDKAGNKAVDLESQSFCVDLTKPSITISGINPNSANNDEGDIGFSIECTDTNFGTFTPVLSAVLYENGSFVTKEITGSASDIGNGERIEYGNLENDGIYSLKCAATDKAGNAYDTVNIISKDGTATSENLQDGDELIKFSVNRNGSTFALDEYSMDVINNYYVQEASEDIVFFETNADELLNYDIKLNGEMLEEGRDYTVSETGGDDSWYKYEYVIAKSLFENEGEYSIVVESEDKATSAAYSDLKNVSANFVIDKTPPTFTISGIEENGNYSGTSQSVTLVPADDGGKLGHVKVTILDKDGNEQETVTDLSGDELTTYLNGNDGMIKFNVPEGVNQQVAILCSDCSVGTDGKTNTSNYAYKGITVSSNAFILFFQNKTLVYGAAAVVVIGVAAPIGTIRFKRKKKKIK